MGGAAVAFGVDATSLAAREDEAALAAGRRFGRIIFNFPHVDMTGRIDLNRQLLRGFLKAARERLAPGGEVWVTLAEGQGSTSSGPSSRCATRRCPGSEGDTAMRAIIRRARVVVASPLAS